MRLEIASGTLGKPTQLALSIDLERCIGCRSCEAACKLEHHLSNDIARNRMLWMQFEGIPRLDFINAVCQQCERPACVRACAHNPKAISKDPADGVVKVNQALCTGCQDCVKACPYNAISFDYRSQKAQKCDLCAERREHGFRPACVSVCPGRALDYGPLETLLAKAEAEGRRRRDVDHFGQNPSTVYLERFLGKEDGVTGGCGDEESGTQGSEMGNVACPPLNGAYLPIVAREGDGVKGVQGKPKFFLARRLPRVAISEALFPYTGGPRIWEADQVAAGGCNLCFNSCTTRYYLKEGKVIAITGNEDDPVLQGRICPKAQMQIQQFYSHHRLTHPMKRTESVGRGSLKGSAGMKP